MKKFLGKIASLILILLVFNYVFVWLIEIPKRQKIKSGFHQKKINWDNIIKNKQAYDIIILGSSRAYCSYNPIVIDSVSNLNSYNIGTGSQNIIESYYILKEIFKYQNPKYIVYEIFLPSFEREHNYYQVLGNAEYMSTEGRWDMILNGFGIQGLYNSIFTINGYAPFLRKSISKFFVGSKSTQSSKTTLRDPFFIKGYKYSTVIVDSERVNNFPPIYSFKNTNVSMQNLEFYLNQMHKLCKVNSVEFLCVRAPYPPTRLNTLKNDTVNAFFEKYLRNNSIQFYDFNYSNINTVYNDSDFVDQHHMNCYGANKVSKELGEILNISMD